MKLALLASWLINALGNPKRPVNPVVLLGLEDKYSATTGERRMSPEEVEASRYELIKRLGG